MFIPSYVKNLYNWEYLPFYIMQVPSYGLSGNKCMIVCTFAIGMLMLVPSGLVASAITREGSVYLVNCNLPHYLLAEAYNALCIPVCGIVHNRNTLIRSDFVLVVDTQYAPLFKNHFLIYSSWM